MAEVQYKAMNYRGEYEIDSPFERNFDANRAFKGDWLAWVLVFTLLFPVRLDYGWAFFSTISVLDLVLLLLFGVLVLKALFVGRIAYGERWVFTILILPIVFAILSLGWSVDSAETVKSIVVYGSAAAAYLLVVALFRRWTVAKLLKTVILLSWTLVLTAVVSYIPGSPVAPQITFAYQNLDGSGFLLSYYARFSHPFLGLSNSIATILAMLLPIVLLSVRLGVWPRFANVTAIILVAAIVATGSRGVLIALLLVLGVVGVWRLMANRSVSRSVFKKLVVGGIALVALVAGFFVLSPTSLDHVGGRFAWGNADARLQAFSAAAQVSVFEHPLGIGSGVSLSTVSDIGLRSVHNAYLQNMLWFGVVLGGILSFAMLLLPYVIWRIRISSQGARYARAAVATSAALLIVINLSQASWEGSVLRIWIYVLLAIGVLIIRRSEETVPRGIHANVG